MTTARSLFAGLTWRMALIAMALGVACAVDKWTYWRVENPPVPHAWILWDFIASGMGAVFIVVAAMRASEATARGARPLLAYALALAGALLATAAVATFLVMVWIGHVDLGLERAAAARHVHYLEFFSDFVQYGGLVCLLHYNRLAAARILGRLHDMESRRVHAERQLVESRLAAAEVQMDPETLLRSLASIRNDFARAAPEAADRLESLIRDRRLALTRITSPGPRLLVP
jgi:hypothetical protein